LVRIRSSQKYFTEEEAVNLTGICAEHLRGFAESKHLGSLAVGAGSPVRQWRFTNSDLMIIAILHPRCNH